MTGRYDGEDWRSRTAELELDADSDALVADGEDGVTITQSVPSGATGEGELLVAGDGVDVPIEDGHTETITTTDDSEDELEVAIRAEGFTPDSITLEVLGDG